MWTKNNKIISLTAAGLIVVAALLYLSTTDTSQQKPSPAHTENNLPPSNPPPSIVESQISSEESIQIADDKPQELSHEMRQAINSFVGKGKGEPEIDKIKAGGNIARLEGRYRHVTVVTIDASGKKKLQEFGPHGVQEEE